MKEGAAAVSVTDMPVTATEYTAPPGDPSFAIVAACARSDIAGALALFEAAGAELFAFAHGYDGLARILDAMPDGQWRHSEALLGALVFHLVKQGRAARAQAHLDDPDLTFERTARFTNFELLVAIHLGLPITPAQLDRWAKAEHRLPLANPLLEGLYFNAMLVILVRLGRITEARAMGRRAIESYRFADHLYLEHFIHLHLADLAILEGHLRDGRRTLATAKRCLAASGRVYGNEAAVIEILDLALDYETGHWEHIPARSADLRAALVSGDSWAEIFAQLGRIAVMSLYYTSGRAAALGELELFHADYTRRHGHVSPALSLVAAQIERLDWRLGGDDAASATHRDDPPTSPVAAVMSADIAAVTDTEETQRPGLAGPRADVQVALVAAARSQGATRRRHVERALRLAVTEGIAAPFVEHRDALAGLGGRLSTARFARGHVQLARIARHVVRIVDQSYWISPRLQAMGISHRQFRVVTALQSGATNKQIARSLGVSEAGVKYHLAKIYRLTGVKRRGELIEENQII